MSTLTSVRDSLQAAGKPCGPRSVYRELARQWEAAVERDVAFLVKAHAAGTFTSLRERDRPGIARQEAEKYRYLAGRARS